MTMTIPTIPTILRPAEWVLPGHPDKLADAVADALVEAAIARQPQAFCAIEVAVHRDTVYLTGRLACEGSDQIDIPSIVRDVYRSAGYGERWKPAPEDLKVEGNLCLDTLQGEEAQLRHISDDQSITIGYAIDLPGTGYIPPEQWLAREVARELYRRCDSPLELCPDGKVLVIVEETPSSADRAPPEPWQWRLRSVSASLLAPGHVSGIELQRAVIACLKAVLGRAAACIPGMSPEVPGDITVNGSGNFYLGGPEGDNGLSGKKLLLDYYGPRVPIGGAALSGKDFHKPDRAGAVIARRLALAVVQSGCAREATVHLAAFPGDEQPRILRIDALEGAVPEAQRWAMLVDCRLASVSRHAHGQSLPSVTRWGHWGLSYQWDRLLGSNSASPP